jgi:hypothetical protein
MKIEVGDLVRWTDPEHMDFGIVTEVDGDSITVSWLEEPEYSGTYRSDCEYMEVLNEYR